MLDKIKSSRSGTFTDNMKLPIHRWFRYSAGFSAEWVKQEIEQFEGENQEEAIILDPFLGSGTTVLAASASSKESFGYEGHPFVHRIAKAKNLWHLDELEYLEICHQVLATAEKDKTDYYAESANELLLKCYTDNALNGLEALKQAYLSLKTSDPVWELVHLNITSILRACSKVGTAQWQYLLPNKTKSKVLDPFEAFLAKAKLMSADMEFAKCTGWQDRANVSLHDVRKPIRQKKSNLVLTSPPYPNNYDYADSTRLEMTFWSEINGYSDLKSVVRPSLLRSCSQHAAGDKLDLDYVLESPELEPIRSEISPVCNELATVRLTKGGKKTYHTMVAAYFLDLAKIWINLRSVTTTGCRICYVIGDSAPYGVYVPADKWLGELAVAAGFASFSFEKLRDRNIKWKNRTHTVPLHEGRLWVEG